MVSVRHDIKRSTRTSQVRRRLRDRRGLARFGALVLIVALWGLVPALFSGSGSASTSAPSPEVSKVSSEASSGGTPDAAGRALRGRSGDVKDTHERIQKIYARLGIQRATKAPKVRENQGCSCQSRGNAKSESTTSRPHFRAPALPPILGWILIGVVVLGMVVPLVLALRSGIKNATPVAAEEPDEEEDGGATLVDASTPWRVSLDRCRRLVAEGRLREAYGTLHRLTLIALEHAGHLSLDATITNWQYVSRLLSKPPLRELLAEVTIAAERSVLGHKPPGPDRYRELEAMLISRVEGVS